ncbi:MAG: hypothetical protein ACI8P9_001961 [Parasphingorhabdus sp.]
MIFILRVAAWIKINLGRVFLIILCKKVLRARLPVSANYVGAESRENIAIKVSLDQIRLKFCDPRNAKTFGSIDLNGKLM